MALFRRSCFAALLAPALLAPALPAFAPAQAQTQRNELAARAARPAAPPLVIQRRSFLDPGKVAPRGSMHNYVGMDTWLREPVYWNQRGLLGLENLPQRFDPPGRPQPLFEY